MKHWFPIAIERDGITINGQYSVERGFITVVSEYGETSAERGYPQPEDVFARFLLANQYHKRRRTTGASSE